MGVAAGAGDEEGQVAAGAVAVEALVTVHVAGKNGVGGAAAVGGGAVQGSQDVRRAAVGAIQRVGGMVDGDEQAFVFRRVVQLVAQPALLFIGAVAVEGAVDVGIQSDDGHKR